MKAKVILMSLLVFSSAALAFASPQIRDILIYEGKEYPIRAYLLEDYFARFPKRQPKSKPWCSGLHRGYRATFAIFEGMIYLKDIHKNVCSDSMKSVLEKVVPDGKPLFIDWTTELIVSGYGDNFEDPYMGNEPFNSSYENYALFEADKGKILDVRRLDNQEFRQLRKKQFEAYKKTGDYEIEANRLLNDLPGTSRSRIDDWIEIDIFSITKRFLVE